MGPGVGAHHVCMCVRAPPLRPRLRLPSFVHSVLCVQSGGEAAHLDPCVGGPGFWLLGRVEG